MILVLLVRTWVGGSREGPSELTVDPKDPSA